MKKSAIVAIVIALFAGGVGMYSLSVYKAVAEKKKNEEAARLKIEQEESERKSEKAAIEAQFFAAREKVSVFLKDPGSAQFKGERVGREKAVCGQVNAKNGFGGYTGFSSYVAPAGDVAYIDPGSEKSDSIATHGFSDAWWRYCEDWSDKGGVYDDAKLMKSSVELFDTHVLSAKKGFSIDGVVSMRNINDDMESVEKKIKESSGCYKDAWSALLDYERRASENVADSPGRKVIDYGLSPKEKELRSGFEKKLSTCSPP
jgi:hypothetical protein